MAAKANKKVKISLLVLLKALKYFNMYIHSMKSVSLNFVTALGKCLRFNMPKCRQQISLFGTNNVK